MSNSFITVLAIALLAVGLDVALILIWRKRQEHRTPVKPPPPLHIQMRVKVQLGEANRDPNQGIGITPRIMLLQPVEAASRALPLPARTVEGIPRAVSALRSAWRARPDVILFSLALFLYLATRFTGLSQYPFYFHGDEAIHTVYASELLHDKGIFEGETFLPTYFKNGTKYNLSLSVYIQILPTLLFGKSILVTRGVSILFTLIPAAAVALIVRDFLKLPYWWSATLLLSLVPAWFLHSRTAFETVLSVSMLAGFLYYYLRYRLENPKSLYPAMVFGALTFYAYNPAQLVIVAFGLILLLADWRYHLKHWQTGIRGLVFLAILALPYLRFRLTVFAPIEDHLRDLGSYWLTSIPLTEKITHFISLYFYGLSPGYWYFPNGQDLPRHQMGSYGNILSITLPFALLGVWISLRSILQLRKKSAHNVENLANIQLTYRMIWIALLVAPLPGTLAQVGITRVLTFVLPITILTAVGVIATVRWLEKWISEWLLATGAFTILAGGILFLTRDALVNGPFWYQEYGFGGMQYGAQQVLGEINHYLDTYNNVHIVLSTDWANGSDFLALFFLDDPFAVEMASVDSFILEKRDLPPYYVLVLTPEEYERALATEKFKSIQVEKTIPYPNGEPGFYFVRMAYADNIDTIFSQEEAARRKLLEGNIQFGGTTVSVRYPLLDMGPIQNAFDGQDDTLIRTNRINPAIIELTLPAPRDVRGVSVNVGASKIRLTIQIFPEDGAEPVEFSQDIQTAIDTPIAVIEFGQTISARSIRLEVLLLENPEFGHVHIWEIRLR